MLYNVFPFYELAIVGQNLKQINLGLVNNNFLPNKIVLGSKSKSDLIILHTEWNEFKNLNFKKLVKKKNFIIYDMRNVYSHKKMISNNINYYGIGV